MKYPKLLFAFALLHLIVLSCSSDTEENDSVSTTSLEGISVEITTPVNLESVVPDEDLLFKGIVGTDSSIDLTNLRAKWISDKDGLIFEETLSQDGETSFSTAVLSKNIHQIKLNIINEVDSIISDSIEIYNAIKLLPIEKTNNSTTLTWCSMPDANFQSFELYRSRFENGILQEDPIYVTNDIQDTTFVDTTAILGEKHYYKVFLNRTLSTPESIGSNFESIFTGTFVNANYPILKIIPDETRNYAYAIVNTVSVFDESANGYGLVFLNLNNLVLENRILQNIRLSDIDLGPNGDYLYACSRSNTLYKINLNTKAVESTFILSRSAHKIEVGNNGKLYYHITPPSSGSTEFRIFDLENAINIPYDTDISDAASSFRHGDFEIDENNVLYHGESNSSGSKLSKLGTTNDSFSLLDQWGSNNYQSPRIVLNNNKLYWNHYLLDLDLNVLGTFQNNTGNTDIKDVSPNGDYALGWRNVFNSSDQSILKEIPGYFDSGIFVNNTRVLIYKNDNPLFEQHDSTIYVYDFD